MKHVYLLIYPDMLLIVIVICLFTASEAACHHAGQASKKRAGAFKLLIFSTPLISGECSRSHHVIGIYSKQ